MPFKINTKEKFHAITVQGPELTANMTGELTDSLMPLLRGEVKNVVLIMSEIVRIDQLAAEKLLTIQQKFYENNASFVICSLQKAVEEYLDNQSLLEMMNVTPTESEAWDIVQMEEIERELMDDTDKFEF